MTDQRDRAQALAEQYVDESLMNEGIAAIETALADAERRVLRDLCGRLDMIEKYLLSARYVEALELTTNTASSIRTKAQATQEEAK